MSLCYMNSMSDSISKLISNMGVLLFLIYRVLPIMMLTMFSGPKMPPHKFISLIASSDYFLSFLAGVQ